jgi:hypothetical protein
MKHRYLITVADDLATFEGWYSSAADAVFGVLRTLDREMDHYDGFSVRVTRVERNVRRKTSGCRRIS